MTIDGDEALIERLRTTADALRGCDESFRKEIASSDIPKLVIEALKTASNEAFDPEARDQHALQAARVVANLVVDDDENREIIHSIGYIEALRPVFNRYSSALSKEGILDEGQFGCLRAIVASLMNISVGSYDPIKTAVVENGFLLDLLRITNALYLPLQKNDSSSQRWQERIYERRTLADWTWKVLDECTVVEAVNEKYSSDWLDPVVRSLEGFAQHSQQSVHEVDEDDDPEEVLEIETHILGSTCTMMDRITGARSDLLAEIFLVHTQAKRPPIEILFDFLEYADAPAHWKDGIPEVDEHADESQSAQAGFDTDKFMGQAKAVIMKCVVEACAEVDLSDRREYEDIWKRFRRWMRSGLDTHADKRGDLVSCALLAIGNQVRSDSSVRQFANDSDLMSTYRALLQKDAIAERQVRYAIVGLLRNLVLPETLKEELGPLALKAFIDWKMFDDDVGVQVMGPLVGGAMVSLKHLCKGNLNNCLAITTSDSINSGVLHSVITLGAKTDDIGIKSESSRILVNILRTLWSSHGTDTGAVSGAQERMASIEVVKAVMDLVRGDNTVLIGEGIMGLVLLTRNQTGLDNVARQTLTNPLLKTLLNHLQGRPLPVKSNETADLLTGAIADAPAKALPTEMRSNICVLLVTLSTVRAKGRAEGWLAREDEVEVIKALTAVSESTEEGDRGVAGPAAQAAIAWQSS